MNQPPASGGPVAHLPPSLQCGVLGTRFVSAGSECLRLILARPRPVPAAPHKAARGRAARPSSPSRTRSLSSACLLIVVCAARASMMAFMSSVRERRRVGELGLGVVRRLRHKLLALQQLPLDHVVHVDELVVVGELALEEAVHPLDDLGEARLLLVLDRRRCPSPSAAQASGASPSPSRSGCLP